MHATADDYDRILAVQFEVPVLVTSARPDQRRDYARSIHSCSRRSRGPFVESDCAPSVTRPLPPPARRQPPVRPIDEPADRAGGTNGHQAVMLEVRFREAEGGTLFLDRIEMMSPHMQGRLLGLMRERPASSDAGAAGPTGVRVIAGASHALLAGIAGGRFDECLFYALNIVHLVLPPVDGIPTAG